MTVEQFWGGFKRENNSNLESQKFFVFRIFTLDITEDQGMQTLLHVYQIPLEAKRG